MDDSQDKSPKFVLKYIMIPIEVFSNPDLTPTDMFVYSVVHSLDGKDHCFASNAFIANVLGINIRQASRSVAKLVESGYFKQVSFDGRKRVITEDTTYKERYKPYVNAFHDREYAEPSEQAVQDSADERCSTDQTSGYIKDKINNCKDDTFSPKKETGKRRSSSSGNTALLATLANAVEEPETRSARPSGIDRSVYSKPTNGRSTIFKPSDRSKIILDYWNSKDGLRTHKEGTKIYKQTSLLIDLLYQGSACSEIFKNTKFRRQDFIQAIDNYHLAATSLDYEPSDLIQKKRLKNKSFSDFILDVDSKKSLFLHYLSVDPVKANTVLKTEVSPTISILAEWYAEYSNISDNTHFSHRDWVNFSKAEEKLTEFFISNKRRINIDTICHLGRLEGAFDELSALALFLAKSVEEAHKESGIDISTGWLCSDNAFNSRFPKYLQQKGVMRQ